jgi:hypothetical protein
LACKEGRTIKQDHVIKKEEFEERIWAWLMFEASWSKEDGPTSFWTFLVITLLALTWTQGAAAWGTRFRLEANFEESGWPSSMIFDMGGHSYKRGLQELSGDKRSQDHHTQVLDHLVAAKEINNSERS